MPVPVILRKMDASAQKRRNGRLMSPSSDSRISTAKRQKARVDPRPFSISAAFSVVERVHDLALAEHEGVGYVAEGCKVDV